MSPMQNIAVAALAGAILIGGAVYVEKDKLGIGFGGIRTVDFRNAPVEVVGTACADPQLTTAGVTNLPLHEGAYQLGQYQFELVGDVRYGDVSGHTGDSTSEKAVFVGSCSTAGKTSQVLFVYGMMDGKPARLASTDLSGGGDTLVQSYEVGNGAIQVRANQGNPPTLVMLSYALLNGNLVSLNSSSAAQPMQAALTTEPGSDTPTNGDVQDAGASAQAPLAQVNEDRIDYATFHDALSPYGQWMDHPRWGTVWHPTQVTSDFAPYRQGHWEDTDDYGTVWVSDYNWGDIPFHYGRWGYDPNYGWLWQPGYTWSPAWVAWREGAGDIGWFPIPPNYYDGTGVFAEDWDGWYGYRALYGATLDAAAFYGLWSFVPADDIYAPSIGVDLVAPALYASFIGRTVGWTRFGLEHGHLVNRAIERGRFRMAFGHPLPGGSRHDFQAHHGPIVGPARGRLIAAHERRAPGFHAPAVAHHVPTSHFAGTRGFGHTAAHGLYAHSTGRSHLYGHSGFAEHSGFAAHSGYAGHQGLADRSGFGAAHSGFGGTQRSGFGGGETRHSGFGGGEAQRSGFGGGAYAQHAGFAQTPRSGFGGGGGGEMQRSGFGGAGFAQRPAMGGAMMSRPAGGGMARPAPAQRPNNHH